LQILCGGEIDAIGIAAQLKTTGSQAQRLAGAGPLPAGGSHEALTAWLLDAIQKQLADVEVIAAGHRVVHGGSRFGAPVRIDVDVLAALEGLIELAPGHEPNNIAAIHAVGATWPAVRSRGSAPLWALPRRSSCLRSATVGQGGL
jgi:acetate kinase